MSSNTYACLLALTMIGGTAVLWLSNRRLASTVVLHNAAWAVGLLIVGSGLLNYRPTPVYAWLILTGAIAAFNVGAALGTRPRADEREPAPVEHRLVPLWAYWTLLLLFTMGLTIYLISIAKVYGISELITDPIAVRKGSEKNVSYLEEFPLYGKVLFYMGPVSFVLTAFPRLVNRLSRTPLLLRILILAYLTVGQMAVIQRTNLFTTIGWVMGVVLVANARGVARFGISLRLRHVAMTLVLCALVFQVIGTSLGKTAADDPQFGYVVGASLRHSSLAAPLHYMAGGIPAFGVLVETDDPTWPPPRAYEPTAPPVWGTYNPQTWGLATLSVPTKLIPGARRWLDIAPFVTLPAATNVYTWLEPWYRDFRAPGAILGALLVGWFVGWAVRRHSETPVGLLFSGLLVGMTVFATFSERFTSTLPVTLLLVLPVLAWVSRPAGAEGVPPLPLSGRPRGAQSATETSVR